MRPSELVTLLAREQGDMSERTFARKLGINHSYWNRLRKGEYGTTWALLCAGIRAFPLLTEEIWTAARHDCQRTVRVA